MIETALQSGPAGPLASPAALRRRITSLAARREDRRRARQRASAQLAEIEAYLAIADGVHAALEKLSQELFGRIVRLLEENLTRAVQEVLEQPIELKVESDVARGSAAISFHMARGAHREDIMRGQGGSVANVLSVGLRLLALTTLDPQHHRRFLVLDEQDCWLRPDLVPRLVRIVHDAGRALGFQVLMISHHAVGLFANYADKIYEFIPGPQGVTLREVCSDASSPDRSA